MMLKSRLIALCGALAVTVTAAPILTYAPPAAAQTADGVQVPRRNAVASRAQSNREERPNREERRNRQAALPSAEEVLAAAREQTALTNTGCEVTNATFRGKTAENTTIYEVACAAGPGYMIETKAPPVASDCIILASSAQAIRQRDPAAQVGPQCELPGSTDVLAMLKTYAQQAGVDCTVDAAVVRGQDNAGVPVYEIGCQGVDGYWIKKASNAWSKTPCLQVLAESGTCALTTPEEQAATVKTWLVGTDVADCNVGKARLMGRNANGSFYEITCNGADGAILRVNEQYAVQQVYPCATAQQIGGGCTLTTAAATAPAGGRT